MTTRGPEELGTPGPHWRGDGTLGPRHELRVEQGVEEARPQPRAYDPTLTLPPPVRPRIAGAPVATFGRRLSATLLDGVILVILLGSTAAISIIGLDPDIDEARIQERSQSVVVLALYGYLLLFNVLGRSPGKRALGLRIVQADGSAPGFGTGLSRMLVSLLTPILIAYFWAAFDGRAQAWHDKASGTYVVHPPKDERRLIAPNREETDQVTWSFPDRPD